MLKLNKQELDNLTVLLINEQYENIALGLEIVLHHPECIEHVHREIILLAQLCNDSELSQSAYEILEGKYDKQQLLKWDKEFELFSIAHELYSTEAFEENWDLFEEHETIRQDYMALVIKNRTYVNEYYTIAKCITEFYRKKLDWSERYYLISLMNRPDDLNVLFTLANFYYDDYTDPVKALQMYDKMLEKEPGHFEAIEAKAFLIDDFYGETDKGIELLEQALKIQENDEKLIQAIAVLMMQHNDLNIYNKGKRRLEKILEKNSQNYYVMTIYGQKLWLREQNAQAASDIFNNILKLNHRDFRSLAYLAEIYINAYNDKNKANEFFRQAFSIYMDSPHHLVNYISFLTNHMQDYKAAWSYYKHLKEYCYKDIGEYNLWYFYNISNEEKERFLFAEAILLTQKF